MTLKEQLMMQQRYTEQAKAPKPAPKPARKPKPDADA